MFPSFIVVVFLCCIELVRDSSTCYIYVTINMFNIIDSIASLYNGSMLVMLLLSTPILTCPSCELFGNFDSSDITNNLILLIVYNFNLAICLVKICTYFNIFLHDFYQCKNEGLYLRFMYVIILIFLVLVFDNG